MSAVEALKIAWAAGIAITLDGEDLVLQAPAPPPASLLNELSTNKPEIVALLLKGSRNMPETTGSGQVESASAVGGPASRSGRPKPQPTDLARGSIILMQAGVRLMETDGATSIGIWSDLDGPNVRLALCTLGSEMLLPIRYLDAVGVPMRYKSRSMEGEPVPMNVLRAMEANPAEPWVIRDRMLDEMGWCSKGKPCAEWKAEELNRLFQEQGVAGEPGRIKAGTVRHGEQSDRGGITEVLASLRTGTSETAKGIT
jgi:hypothetical protein